ncbi:MAG: helix-turn-helix transcriptional regulator [Promicromonosporaceae bacterium]|nr:helix-turn-helix transcriptional regulator [Promicromonosporaceae bacterium]
MLDLAATRMMDQPRTAVRAQHVLAGRDRQAIPPHKADRANRTHNARFGDINVTYLEHPEVDYASDGELLARDGDLLRLIVLLEGEFQLKHDDASATLAKRDSGLILSSLPVSYSSEIPCRVVICDIPADHGGLGAVPRSAPFVVGRADAAVPAALGAFLVDLLRQDTARLSPINRAQIADVLRTLVTSTVMSLAVAGCSGWDLRRQRLAALRHIAARYADPDLSSASVAEHLGLSRRSLQRLFEDEDRTVAQRIQEVRTQHAVARLKDKRFAQVSLGEIATLAGFGSTVAMRRAVQDATNLTPTDLRRKALLSVE